MDKIDFLNKKILITGGEGYLGHNLILKLISLKAKVYCVDIIDVKFKNCYQYFKVDLLNKEELNRIVSDIEPEIIYHLAANIDRSRDFSITNRVLEVNLNGTINLLNSLMNVKYENLIFTSTSEVYGGSNIISPFKEESDFVPASPYSLSKYSAEVAIRTFSELYGKNYTILRLFNFYGEGMSKNFFLPQLINKIKKDEDFDMTFGEQRRDFLYIDDVVQSLLLSTNKEAYNETFNVCSGKGLTIKELANSIKRIFNSKSKINLGSIPYRENEVWEMIGSNEKIRKKLGFIVSVDLIEHIRREMI